MSITLASSRQDGTIGNSGSGTDLSGSQMTANGRFMVFVSGSDNLVAGDVNRSPDVFIKNIETGEIFRVNTDQSGSNSNNFSFSTAPAVSADGRFVVFSSTDSTFVPNDTNGGQDVFVKDLSTGTITRVSTNAAGD